MEQITVYVIPKSNEDNDAMIHRRDGYDYPAKRKVGYFFTPEEMEEVIGKAFDAGVNRALYKHQPNKTEYINTLKQQ
jgi:hypothetical protein